MLPVLVLVECKWRAQLNAPPPPLTPPMTRRSSLNCIHTTHHNHFTSRSPFPFLRSSEGQNLIAAALAIIVSRCPFPSSSPPAPHPIPWRTASPSPAPAPHGTAQHRADLPWIALHFIRATPLHPLISSHELFPRRLYFIFFCLFCGRIVATASGRRSL